MMNKNQLLDEIKFEEKMLGKYNIEREEKIKNKEKDCTIECLVFMSETKVSCLKELLEKYFQPKKYSFCMHCHARWISTPEEEKDTMCPKCHYFAFRPKLMS